MDLYAVLRDACVRGDLALVTQIIAQAGDINDLEGFRPARDLLPLFIASSYGHTPVVRALVASGAFVNSMSRGSGALHIACSYGHGLI